MNLYTIHDSAAEYYFLPFVARTDGEAQRMFIVSMGENFIHRASFSLYHIGTFNQDDAAMEIFPKKHIIHGSDIAPELDPRGPALPMEMPPQKSNKEKTQ